MALEVNNENIENVLKEKSVTVLQFSADWCGPCKMLSPVISKISEEFQDKDVSIGKVNVDISGELGVKYGVRNIPTVVFLKDGVEVEGSRIVGMKTKADYENKINELLN